MTELETTRASREQAEKKVAQLSKDYNKVCRQLKESEGQLQQLRGCLNENDSRARMAEESHRVENQTLEMRISDLQTELQEKEVSIQMFRKAQAEAVEQSRSLQLEKMELIELLQMNESSHSLRDSIHTLLEDNRKLKGELECEHISSVKAKETA
jgi:hypothetical protein